MRTIPKYANQKDWPRLVANALNDLQGRAVKQFSVFIDGKPSSAEIITSVCPSGITIETSSAKARIASTGTSTFSIDRIRDFVTTNIGSVVFTTSDIGVVTLTDPIFEQNDILQIIAPGTPDATLDDILITLRG